MACVKPDGTPTASGIALLKALESGLRFPEDVAEQTEMPLFRVRSGLRELSYAGLTQLKDGGWELTAKGAASLTTAS